MNERIEPTQKGCFSESDLKEKLKQEGKEINFCRFLYVGDVYHPYPRYNEICTPHLAVYSQKYERGFFVRDEDGRELHLRGKHTNWWPCHPFLLGGEEDIPENHKVKLYGLPKLQGGIGMDLIGKTFDGPVETHEERAIIVFSFMKNSKVKTIRNDWKWETKDPDDSH